MAAMTRPELVRWLFRAFHDRDRAFVETLFSEDFRFTSPYDDHIDKAQYFVRCWPNAGKGPPVDVLSVAEHGDEVFALYQITPEDGAPFRNIERYLFSGQQIKSVEVYFGSPAKT